MHRHLKEPSQQSLQIVNSGYCRTDFIEVTLLLKLIGTQTMATLPRITPQQFFTFSEQSSYHRKPLKQEIETTIHKGGGWREGEKGREERGRENLKNEVTLTEWSGVSGIRTLYTNGNWKEHLL